MSPLLILVCLVFQVTTADEAGPTFTMTFAKELPFDGVGIEVELAAPPANLEELRDLICKIKRTEFPASLRERLGDDIPKKSRPNDYQGMVVNVLRVGGHNQGSVWKYVQDEEVVIMFFGKDPVEVSKLSLEKFRCSPQR
jgi:hypothetical protein